MDYLVLFFNQKTAYDMRIRDWSSDVCSSDLLDCARHERDKPKASAQLHRVDRLHPAAIAGHDRLVRRVLRPQAGHEAAALIVEQDRGPRVGFFGDEAAIDRRDPLRMADIEAVRRKGLHDTRLKAAVAALGRPQRGRKSVVWGTGGSDRV